VTMTMPIMGRCACGAVTYACTGEPIWMVNCHCRDCQKATGSGYAPLVFLPRAATSVTGDLRWHAATADSGTIVERGFCPQCGNPMMVTPPRMPEALAVFAGSLDHPGLHAPRADLFCDRAHAWDTMAQDTRKFPRGR
jgi:hypothetical protein